MGIDERLKVVLNATERLFVDDSFADKHDEIMALMPDHDKYLIDKQKLAEQVRIKQIDCELLPCWQEPLLNKAQDFHIARQFNYLKHRARQAALARKVKQAEQFLEQSLAPRELLVLANMRLCVFVTKKITSPYQDDILSEAFLNLLKAADYFDWRKNLRFCTYATWVIRQNMWRMNEKLQKGFTQGNEEAFFNIPANIEHDVLGTVHRSHVALVNRMLRLLENRYTHRERQIIEGRYGIDAEPLTLGQCGERFKVTKERIRQLESRSMEFLRQLAREEQIVFEEVA